MNSQNWINLGKNLNESFYFVIDILIKIQGSFIDTAMAIGSFILLIAILSAALNYALTGTGLKENFIKILKATLFFLIVIAAYPKIVGTITSWTFHLAYDSVGKAVENYFGTKTREITTKFTLYEYGGTEQVLESTGYAGRQGPATYYTRDLFVPRTLERTVQEQYDNLELFNNLTATRTTSTGRGKGSITYTAFAPATVLQIILLIAGDCISYAEDSEKTILGQAVPDFSRILKGLICAFFLIFTGVFALLEYIVCFLEFMLVASVGIILFPLSIWEGTKFMAEKYIGAMLGFFIKLLFCNIAIFLMLYGFITLFYILQGQEGFKATPDQLLFIIFSCMLFFFICKSAPNLAQSLLTGTPTLNAAGAISAVGGAVAAAGATMSLAKKGGNAVSNQAQSVAGGIASAGLSGASTLVRANSAANKVKSAGGSAAQQRAAFGSSIGQSIGGAFKAGALGLTRSLLGANSPNPYSNKGKFQREDGNFGKYFNSIK